MAKPPRIWNGRTPSPRDEEERQYRTDKDPPPWWPDNRLTRDTDVNVKVCKLWFDDPYLTWQEIAALLTPEHPTISQAGITTIIKDALRHGLVSACINYPTGTDRLSRDTDLHTKVCKLWYHYPHLSERDIVEQLRGEHPDLKLDNVARIIRQALREGLVTAHLNYPSALVERLTLEIDLLRTFPTLRIAKVVEASPRIFENLDEAARRSARRDVILRLAPLVAGIIDWFLRKRADDHPEEQTIVGVGWGVTLYYLRRYLAASPPPRIGSRLEFVPIIGLTARPQEFGLDAHNLATRLAELYGGRTWSLPAPALLTNLRARQAEGFPDVERALQMLERAHMVITSIAPVANGGVGDIKLSNDPNVNEALLKSDRWQYACGRIGLSFFDEQGRAIPLKYHRAIGMLLSDLGKVARDPDRISMTLTAGDPARVPGILGALRGYLVSHLLTDKLTARALLAAERGRTRQAG